MSNENKSEQYRLKSVEEILHAGKVYEQYKRVLTEAQEWLAGLPEVWGQIRMELHNGDFDIAHEHLTVAQQQHQTRRVTLPPILDTLYTELGNQRQTRQLEEDLRTCVAAFEPAWDATLAAQVEVFWKIQQSARDAVQIGNWRVLAQIIQDGRILFHEVFGEPTQAFDGFIAVLPEDLPEGVNRGQAFLRFLRNQWVGLTLAGLGALALVLYAIYFGF